jgi:glycerol-3-phosphate dehydrogenase
VGSVVYFDCHTDDARLTLENVLDAEALGAVCGNHLRATELLVTSDGRTRGAVVVDRRGRTTEVRARLVVSAVGPWTSKFLGKPVLRPTKGIHIVVPSHRLPVTRAMVLFLRNRTIFAIPEGARTVLGTTDTDFDDDPSTVHATAEDVRDLLAIARYSFPSAKLTADDVISTWAGVRPLIASDAASTSAVPREHEIWDEPNGLVVVAGGKLTTYRHMAEEIVDHVVERLRDMGWAEGVRPCSTEGRPLPGTPETETVQELAKRLTAHVPEDVAQHLVFNYGARAEQVLASGPLERIAPDLPHLWAEIDHAILYERAQTVDDVLSRRVKLLLYDRDQGMRAAPTVADRIAHLRGLSATEQAEQLSYYQRVVQLSRRWRNA